MSVHRHVPPRLGIVCALLDEARALGLRRPDPDHETERGAGVLVKISGMGPERAAAATESLLERGCRALVSFGYCGALDASLAPGTLILPERLFDREGVVETDPEWRGLLLARLRDRGIEGRAGILAGSSRVLGAEEKRVWASRGSASVVDMESCTVARRSRERGARCVVLRVVLDRRDVDVPPSLAALLDPWGRWNAPWSRRCAGLLRVSPTRLVALAGARRRAFRTLRQAARVLAPDFSLPDERG